MTTAEKIRAIREGQATPATPACSTNTPIRLPMTLMIFDAIDKYIVTLVFPMLRKKSGTSVINSQCRIRISGYSKISNTGLHHITFHFSKHQTKHFLISNQYQKLKSDSKKIMENSRSWLADSPASFTAFLPKYWLITTAPPDASAVNR